MPEFIRRFERHYETNYWLVAKAPSGSAMIVPCNVDGDPLDCDEQRLAMLDELLAQGADTQITEHETAWNEYAIIRCQNCGAEVELYGFTNTCRCGADYNMEGVLLADRGQWGEETGETAADILMGGGDEW